MRTAKIFIFFSFYLFWAFADLSIGANVHTSTKKNNVLLITIDTLRADYIGALKERSIHTPVIDNIAATSILFSNVFTAAPLTLPSHTSILTGTYPSTHKVRNNSQYFKSSKIFTLATLFKQQSYHTYAITAAFVLHSRFGLAKDFDYYSNVKITKDFSENVCPQFIERNAGAVLDESKKMFNSVKEPFFAWVHFYDPHSPYNPPEEFRKNNLNNLYQGEVEYVDHTIGQLFAYLKTKNLLNNTVIIIASDHGESLGEHKEKTHGHFLYNATIRVPLIIHAPALKPQKITTFVSTIDIAPTILDLADIPIPSFMEGVSLLHLEQIRSKENNRVLYSETYQPFLDYHWAPLQSLIYKNLKYISSPKAELFDLQKDATELHNVITTALYEPDFWKNKLKDYQDTTMADTLINSENREKLLSLGYAAGSTKTAPSFDEMNKLPDPKDKVDDLNAILDATDYVNAGNFPKAIAVLTDFYALEKTNVRALFLLSYSHYKLNQWDKALDYIEKTVALNPMYQDQLYLLKAEYYRKQHNMPEAEKYYLEAIKVNPQEFAAYNNLSQIAYMKRDYNSAISYLQKAVELSPEDIDSKNNLALLLLNQKKYEEATSLFLSILETQPDHQYALLNLTNAYLKTNEYEKAYQSMHKLITLYPDKEKYYIQFIDICINLNKTKEANEYRLKLADLYENSGQVDKAISQLLEIQVSDPNNQGITARIEKLRQQTKPNN